MKSIPSNSKNGFALVVTLTLMVLLSILALGLLSLSTVSLRSMNASSPADIARANARMAVMMALGELQRTAGDDRRITADASIDSSAKQPNLVGVWDGWSPNFAANPTQIAPDYDVPKTDGFKTWLVSNPDQVAIRSRAFASSTPTPDAVDLFNITSDGFSIKAPRVPMKGGSYAWAVSQEGTKAKINVGGPDQPKIANDEIQAQARPNLSLSDRFSQPDSGWEARSAKVVSMHQAGLDVGLADTATQDSSVSADFTSTSKGLITNPVAGGLKVDLNLGFELSDADFASSEWNKSTSTKFATPSTYKTERPLFLPISDTATHTPQLSNFDAAKVQFNYNGAGVPTFNLLRSFYRIPHHLYKNPTGDITAFERASDHIAFKPTPPPSGMFHSPWALPPATQTRTGIRPVVDRVMFLISAGLSDQNFPQIIYTPVVTLWNPYNVALEIEGAVAYPWLDVPFNINFTVYNSVGTQVRDHGHGMSTLLGRQLKPVNHGRSVDPYFYAAITATGENITSTTNIAPIRFGPGEVRVFVPKSPVPKNFQPSNYTTTNDIVQISGITTYLRPVENASDYNTRGGIGVQLANVAMAPAEFADMKFGINAGSDYPCFISVEDATRAKGNPTTAIKGQPIADIQQRYYGQSGEFGQAGGDRGQGFRSVRKSQGELRSQPQPVAVLEFFHRYARTGNEQGADLVYTGNPRQPWMAEYMTNGTFSSGPQYRLRVRGPISSFNQLLQTENGGRSAFYGPSNGVDGFSRLPFFEIPRDPMLSLAGFQHADLTSTPFGPSNQFANSWASAYLPRNKVAQMASGSSESAKPPIYDSVYLTNEALWDGFFMSGAVPTINQSSLQGRALNWNSPVASTTRSVSAVLEAFVKDPTADPLRNPRMQLDKGGLSDSALTTDLSGRDGCLKIAGHLMVDGAFNVNSTSVEAWKAILSGLKGSDFQVENGTGPNSADIAFPRFRHPTGSANNSWNGYRTLSKDDIKLLAERIVAEVKKRGPFLSLGEFVNRRVSRSTTDPLALSGVIQSAIDGEESINSAALFDEIKPALAGYPPAANANISPARTGVGIPGFLTQADVLQSIAPILTVRSDTFTIRGYGEAHDKNGKVIARAICEAVVQRMPAFVDGSDLPYTSMDKLNPTNKTFGRRFSIISFRILTPAELKI